MAELAASIIGIVSAGTKVTLILAQLSSDVGSAGKEARLIGSEIRGFITVVKTLGATMEKVQESPYYAHCADLVKDMTDASLEMFTEILNAADGLKGMTKGKDGKDGRFGFMGRVQWAVFQKPKISVLRTAMEAYKSNLTLMLGTLSTAEKVGRRMSMVNTKEVIAEDDEDRSILQALQLEYQASLIEVEEARRLFDENTNQLDHHAEGLESSSHEETEEERPNLVTQPRNGESWTESLVDSARQEIKSMQYSQRLSILMSTDQNRIGQRWPPTLSPSYESNPNKHLSYTKEASSTTNSTLPEARIPPTSQILPLPPTCYERRGPSIRTSKKNAFNDRLYKYTFKLLMLRPEEDRRTILDALTKGVYGTLPTPSPHIDSKVANQGSQDALKSEDEYETRIQQCMRQLAEIRGTPQWHQAREIQNIVRQQMQAKIKDPGYSNEKEHLMAINLSHKNFEFLPSLVIEILRYNLVNLAMSHNQLTTMPGNLDVCSHLRCLNLRDNRFTTIPDPVLQLASLETLDMSCNKLRTIPGTILRLKSLKILLVQKNQIQGLPFALGHMENLFILRYQYNPVIFPIEQDIDNNQFDANLDMDSYNAWDQLKTDPKTGRLKRYLRNYPAKVSGRNARAILGLLPPSLETISTNLFNAFLDITPTRPILTLDTFFSSVEEISRDDAPTNRSTRPSSPSLPLSPSSMGGIPRDDSPTIRSTRPLPPLLPSL